MAEFFGVGYSQVPTALVAPATVDASLPIAFGTAPIHRLEPEARAKAMPGSIILCYSDAEAGAQLGIVAARDDFKKWGLSEQAFSQFALYGKAPGLYVNIFDPNVHNVGVTGETLSFYLSNGFQTAFLSHADAIDGITITDTESTPTTYVAGTDYTVNNITGAVKAIDGSALEAAITANKTIKASYKYAAPELVTVDDVIGGYDAVTGKTTGLELIEQAFPKYRMTPGIILAPNFSQDPTVAMIMAAKCVEINGVFGAVAYADLPSDNLNVYSNVPAYKNKNGLVSENLYLCWPKTQVGERLMNLATHAAGATAAEDRARNGIPYASPSNNALQCQGAATGDGNEVSLTLPQANYLRENGIATILNFTTGNVLWGTKTAAAPGNTDPVDMFISSRRMIAWLGNRLILTWFQKVDDPNNRRLIQTIVNSEQISLNSLVAVGALTGGNINFIDTENSLVSLMAGKIVFDIVLGLVSPAQNIQFRLQYEPAFLQSLFQ